MMSSKGSPVGRVPNSWPPAPARAGGAKGVGDGVRGVLQQQGGLQGQGHLLHDAACTDFEFVGAKQLGFQFTYEGIVARVGAGGPGELWKAGIVSGSRPMARRTSSDMTLPEPSRWTRAESRGRGAGNSLFHIARAAEALSDSYTIAGPRLQTQYLPTAVAMRMKVRAAGRYRPALHRRRVRCGA